MRGTQITAIALIACGALALAFGGVVHMKDTRDTRAGPVVSTVTEHQPTNAPVWAGAAALVAGVLLVMRAKRKLG